MGCKNNRQRGKAHEKRVAELLNGARVGLLGGEDVFTANYSVECKSRQKFIGTGWMEQAVRNNKKNKIPIVVVHVAGTRSTSDLVILKMEDFLTLTNQRGG